MVYFRADANANIGTGHVMRCLAIASALSRQGHDCTFITADREAEPLILSYGFSILCLDSAWNDLNTEIETLTNLLRQLQIKQLLIDSYYVTETYLDNLRLSTKIIYMDDLCKFPYPVDVLINYNIYSNRMSYSENYGKGTTKLLLGCDYVPLRAEFSEISASHVRSKATVTDIMITTGGSDPFNMAEEILDYLYSTNRYFDIKFHVVVGRFNAHKEALKLLAAKYQNIILHYNVTKMSSLMAECDLAISAGGSTLYELCACGVPTVSYAFADNQLEGVSEFHHQDIIYYAGDIRVNTSLCLQEIDHRLLQLISDPMLREKLSAHMKSLVDGHGADRIIDQILFTEDELC